jgi:hypothetical protein
MLELKNKVIIKQEIELLEIFTGFETGNKYSILDENNKKIAYAYENNTNFIIKQILGSHRNLNLHILNEVKKEILIIERPFFFLNCNATIKLPNGEILGYLEQKKWFGNKQFNFYGPNKEKLLTCKCKFPKLWTFNLFINNEQVGQILKKWSGSAKEMFTDADTFFIDFGKIKDNSLKLGILATAFIIDLRVFEKKS